MSSTVGPSYNCHSSLDAMRFQIYSGERLIGRSNLDKLDPPMGIARGDFLPSEDYHTVQPVFLLYAEASVEAIVNGVSQDSGAFERYYRGCDSLDLTVRLPDGEVVPTQWIHIEDFSVELGEMHITMAIPDWQTFARYFE